VSSLQAVIFSANDDMANTIGFDTVTNIKSYLKYTMTSADEDTTANSGVIVNLDILGNLKKMENELKIYLWIANEDDENKVLKVKGCATSTCSNIIRDFSVDIGGAKAQVSKKIAIQEISLVKNADGTIKLTLNRDDANAKDIWHDSKNNKLWVQFTFVTSKRIKLSTFQVFISKIIFNLYRKKIKY
jgi:hypothetical protein